MVLWRGGLRIQEALSLIESDLDPRRGSILIRRGKGNRRREVGMDAWAWSDHLAPWLAARVELPVGALFCVIDGPTRGRPWSATAARGELRRYAAAAGVRRRFAPHQYADIFVMPMPSTMTCSAAYTAGIGRHNPSIMEACPGVGRASRPRIYSVSSLLSVEKAPQLDSGSNSRRRRYADSDARGVPPDAVLS